MDCWRMYLSILFITEFFASDELYLAHVLQFLHYTTNIPNLVLNGIMVLNVVIAVVAVMFPAWKMGKENIISEIRR